MRLISAIILAALVLVSGSPAGAQSGSPEPTETATVPATPAAGGSRDEAGTWRLASIEHGAARWFQQIVPWGEGFAALGYPRRVGMEDQARTVRVWLSADGAVWRRAAHPIQLPSRSARAAALVAFDGGLMAIGSKGRRLLVWRLTEDERWRPLPDRPAFGARGIPRGRGYGLRVYGADAVDGRLIVGGVFIHAGDSPVFGRLWATDDGRSWTAAIPDAWDERPVGNIGPGRRSFMGTIGDARGCHDSGQAMLRSRDGLSWQRIPGVRRVCGMGAVAYEPRSDAYYATSFRKHRAAILASDDRRTWDETFALEAELPDGPLELVPTAFHVDRGAIAVIAEARTYDEDWNVVLHLYAAVSADGHEWHASLDWPGTSASYRASGLGHGRLVVALGMDLWYADIEDLTAVPTLEQADSPASRTDALERWGPLAVIQGGGGPGARTGHGTLSIGADCVTLTADQTGEEVTLVWGSDRTSWRPQKRQIVSTAPPNGTTRLSDGDRVWFGGMAIDPESEVGVAWLEGAWVQRPALSCPTDQWYVGDVNVLE